MLNPSLSYIMEVKNIKILGYDYTLDVSKSVDGMEGNVGITNFDMAFIQVANDLPKQMFSSTLLHELIEAVNYHLEIELTERQVKNLEVGLFSVLDANNVDITSLTS